jgi:AcrR family transcriptional regulator
VTKSSDKRTAIVDRLADHVLQHGLAASTLRPLAQAVGLSDRMLLYYFSDKADVMTSTLTRLTERLAVELNAAASTPLPPAALLRRIVDVVLADRLWPYMQLWLEIAALSSRGDAFYRATGEAIARGFLAWAQSQLTVADAEAEAARLLVTVEGIVVLHSVGLHDVSAFSLD